MRIFFAVLLASIAFGAITPASAQVYPTKPIHLVIPFPPGGGADAIARPLAPRLADLLGQPVVIENRPGANANIGAGYVAKATADGYTLLLANSSLTISASLYRNLPFDPMKDLIPIGLVANTPSLLVTHPSVPAKNAKELVELIRARPGKLSYGSAGVGSTMHLGAELLRSMANLDIVHVPYKGGGPAITDLLGGRTQFVFANPVAVLAQVRAGKLNVLAVTSKKRLAIFPDVPTFEESGFPGLISNTFYGVLGPAGMPREIAMRINAAISTAAAANEVRDPLIALGYEMETGSPQHFAAFLKEDVAEWARLVKLSGATAE